MSLLDRVTSLIRANLNDLIDHAEDPEKLLKQLLLDMQNQFMQLKTQTAIAIADQHLLTTKQTENASAQANWLQKAELAMKHQDEPLARVALERSLAHESAVLNFAQQLEDQGRQVTSLRESLARLEAKMAETRTQADLLIARHRRARTARQTGAAAFADLDRLGPNQGDAFQRIFAKVSESEALGHGFAAMSEPNAQSKLETLARNDRIDGLLAQLKTKQVTDT